MNIDIQIYIDVICIQISYAGCRDLDFLDGQPQFAEYRLIAWKITEEIVIVVMLLFSFFVFFIRIFFPEFGGKVFFFSYFLDSSENYYIFIQNVSRYREITKYYLCILARIMSLSVSFRFVAKNACQQWMIILKKCDAKIWIVQKLTFNVEAKFFAGARRNAVFGRACVIAHVVSVNGREI